MADQPLIPNPRPLELARRVAAGAGWAQVSRIAEVIASFALSLILVRALGPDSFGQYSFLVNVATFAAIAKGVPTPSVPSGPGSSQWPGRRGWMALAEIVTTSPPSPMSELAQATTCSMGLVPSTKYS